MISTISSPVKLLPRGQETATTSSTVLPSWKILPTFLRIPFSRFFSRDMMFSRSSKDPLPLILMTESADVPSGVATAQMISGDIVFTSYSFMQNISLRKLQLFTASSFFLISCCCHIVRRLLLNQYIVRPAGNLMKRNVMNIGIMYIMPFWFWSVMVIFC